MRASSVEASRTFAYASSRRRRSSTSAPSSSESARSGRSDLDLISRSVAAIWMKKAVSSTGKTSCVRTCSTKSSVIEARAKSFTRSFLASTRSSTTPSGPSYASVLMLKSSGIAFGGDFVQERIDAVEITRECGGLLHVIKLEHTRRESLEAGRAPAVRGHTVFERLEIEGEELGVKATAFHLRDHFVVVMDALAPAIYFESAEKEVETLAISWITRVSISIEGAFGGWKIGDEDEIASLLLQRPLAYLSFVLWLKVRILGDVKNLLCLAQCEDGELLAELEYRGIESPEYVRTRLPYCLNRIAYRLLEHRHDVKMVFDEAHLEVHLSELGEVAGGRAPLGAEYFGDGGGALKRADHNLLIELGRRGEVGRLVIVVLDLEGRGAALGIATNQRGSLEFSKMLASERLPIGLNNCCLDSENIATSFTAEREGAIIKKRIKIDLGIFLEREFRRLRNDGYVDGFQLHTPIGPIGAHLFWPFVHCALNRDDPFGAYTRPLGQGLGVICRANHLHNPGAIADIEEDELAMVATDIYPTSDSYGLADVSPQ